MPLKENNNNRDKNKSKQTKKKENRKVSKKELREGFYSVCFSSGRKVAGSNANALTIVLECKTQNAFLR